jgi:hypothetical protein
MKLFFSGMIAILFSVNALAKPVVLLTFHDSKEKALQTRKILIESLHIPVFLIEEKKSASPCDPQSSLLQICVDDKENVLMVKNENMAETSKALAVFVKGNPEALQEFQKETGTDQTVPALQKDEIE